MAKIKIAFDANGMVGQKTGVGTLTEELISSLALLNKDYDFTGYYSNFMGRQKSLSSKTPNLKYKESIIIHPKIQSLLRKFNIVLPIELFSKTKVDLNLFTNFVGLPSIYKTKNIVMVHDLCFIDQPEFVSEKNGAYLRKWVSKSLSGADLVITISEFTKQRIAEVYDYNPENIHVMAVPPKSKIQPDNAIIKNLELDDYILFVGTLEPRKNILGLLESYELLPKELQNKYPLVLVGGKGWKDEKILQKIETMQKSGLKIIQTGYVTDQEKSALYESCSVVLQLSHYEGFGMPVLEAMSYGKPVICSNIPVFHEIAQDAVLYVDKDNPSEVAQTINELLTNKILRDKLSSKSSAYVSSYPTWQDVAESISPLLNI